MRQAIITDLDRTLLKDDKSISDYTLHILEECKRKNILLVVATARPLRAIKDYDKAIGFDAKITLNGASVVLPNEVRENTICIEDVMHILEKLMQLEKCVISLETSEGIFSNVPIPEWNTTVYPDLMSAPVPNRIYKVLVSSNVQDLKSVMPAILPDSVYYSIANGELFQIMSKSATKWSGIEAVLDYFKLEPEDTIYFGDDNDDIEPLSKCGTGIAVSNAIEEVKKIADEIVESNNEDGVARYLESKLNF